MTIEVERCLAEQRLARGSLPPPDAMEALEEARLAARSLLHPSRWHRDATATAPWQAGAEALSHVLRRTARLAEHHPLAVVVADVWVDLEAQVLAGRILAEIGCEQRAGDILRQAVTEASRRITDLSAGLLPSTAHRRGTHPRHGRGTTTP